MSGKRILFIESFNCTPHIETAFELAKNHLEFGDIVYFDFIGHALPYYEGWSLATKRRDVFFDNMLPENKGAILLKNKKQFHYKNYFRLNEPTPETINFVDIESLKGAVYKDINIGLGLVSSIISKHRISDLDFANKEIVLDIERGLKSASQVVDFCENRIRLLKPDILYIFNGRFCNVRPLFEIAQKSQVKFKFHERGSSMYKYELFDAQLHDASIWQKRILLNAEEKNWDQLQHYAANFFESRRNRQPKDWHSFVENQKKGKLPLIDISKKLITYYQSSDDEYAAVGDLYKWNLFINQLDAFINVLKIMNEMVNFQLVLRMHPNMSTAEYELKDWEGLDLPENVIYVGPEEDIDSYELMEHSDLIIVAGSTMGIESIYWGKPCVSLGPSLYSELNAVFIPKEIDDIKWALENIEKLPIGRDGAIKYGAFMNSFGKEYKYYRPDSLSSGKFMGRNLREHNSWLMSNLQNIENISKYIKRKKRHLKIKIKNLVRSYLFLF
jgi:hypothetical protein